jgi:hypothetical protein
MNVFRCGIATTAILLLSGCGETAPGPVGSVSGREKGTPTAAAGTPAEGAAPAPAAGAAELPKPAAGGHAK